MTNQTTNPQALIEVKKRLCELVQQLELQGGCYFWDVSLNCSHSFIRSKRRCRQLVESESGADALTLNRRSLSRYKCQFSTSQFGLDGTVFSFEGNVQHKKSYVELSLVTFDFPDLVGKFKFFSDSSAKELNVQLERNMQNMVELLVEFQRWVLLGKAMPLLNPFTAFGVLSSKGSEVLELISLGKSRLEIAEELHLTQRGVDYHVHRLREVFSAKSNAHLVREAYRYKAIN